MTALLALIGPKFILLTIGFTAFVAGLLGFGASKKRQGRAEERARQAASEAKARDISDEIDDAVAGRTADENRERLRKWSR
jgi:uncharacterized membrane protein YraQ (UPF0718 family)